MKKALNWFILSSKDPSKLSLTIKSISVLALLLGIDKMVIDEGEDTFIALIVAIGMVASALSGVYGFLRKFNK